MCHPVYVVVHKRLCNTHRYLLNFVKYCKLCEIRGSHGGADKDSSLLEF